MFAEQLFEVKYPTKEIQKMSTGMIVTPVWENVDMKQNLQFNPVLNEQYRSNLKGLSPGQEVDAPAGDSKNISEGSSNYFQRRFFVGLLLIIIGALFWTAISLVVGVGEKQVGADLTSDAPREIYIVAPGDTLWSIASAIDTDGDPRDTIDRLADLNGGSSIYIGQRLILSS
jgi:hypothetical protein|tara:strand:+ start:21016 stop:21531 length:516 start_codon:yes stop_codon:yes gene_type:complete